MDIHTGVVFIMIVSVIRIHRQHRKQADELNTLTENIAQSAACHLFVIRGQRQDTLGHHIHDIRTDRFHDDIPSKIHRKNAALPDDFLELRELLLFRQLTEKQQIRYLFKSEFFVAEAADQGFDLIAAIPQLAVAGLFFPFDDSR